MVRPGRLEDVEDDDVRRDQEEENTPSRIKQTTQDFTPPAHVQQPGIDQRHQACQAGHPKVWQHGPPKPCNQALGGSNRLAPAWATWRRSSSLS